MRRIKLDQDDLLAMKLGVTYEFAKDHGISPEEAFHLMNSVGAYEYIERNGPIFTTQTYSALAHRIAREFHIGAPA